MRFRIALFLLAVAAIGFAISSMRSKFSAAVERPISDGVAPIEEQMRDAIQASEPGETSGTVMENEEIPAGPKLALSRGKLGWEATIESITNAGNLSDTAKARQLLAMIATLPEHGMTVAAEEAVKRLPDADYDAIALPVVMNPQTHGLVEGVLFDDLMRRPDAITLPALLHIARIPNHPYAKFAHDNLDLLIGEDFGADWLKWEMAVKKALTAEK